MCLANRWEIWAIVSNVLQLCSSILWATNTANSNVKVLSIIVLLKTLSLFFPSFSKSAFTNEQYRPEHAPWLHPGLLWSYTRSVSIRKGNRKVLLQALKILLRYFIIILTNKLKTAQLKMFQRFLFFRLLTDVVDKGCFEIVKDFVPQVEFLFVDLVAILKRVTFPLNFNTSSFKNILYENR